MPSTGATYANQSNLLRTVYARDIRTQFFQGMLPLQLFQRQTETLAEGKNWEFPLHAGGGEGITWSSAGKEAPAGREQIEAATFKPKWTNLKVRFDEDLLEASSSREAATKDPYNFNITEAVKLAKSDLAFDMMGDGSGLLANLSTAASENTAVVDSIRGLRANMRVDVLIKNAATAGAAVGYGVSGAQISVNRKTKTITLLGGKTFTNYSLLNSQASLYGVYRSGSFKDVMFGIDAAINDANPPTGVGNYGNIDRTVAGNEFYQANVDEGDGNPRAPTPKMFQDMLDRVENSSVGKVTDIWCGQEVWSHMVEQVRGNTRWDGGKTLIKDWAEAYMFGSIPMTKLKQCDPTKAYFLNRESFVIRQTNPGEWYDRDGRILRKVDGYLSCEATWHWRLNLICKDPIGQGVIKNLAYVPLN